VRKLRMPQLPRPRLLLAAAQLLAPAGGRHARCCVGEQARCKIAELAGSGLSALCVEMNELAAMNAQLQATWLQGLRMRAYCRGG
jgi:hypothetical protein